MNTFPSCVHVGVAAILVVGSSAVAQDPNCELSNPSTGAARLEVVVTRPSINYRYEYVVVNPAASTGCIRGAMIDVRTQVSGGTVTVGAGIQRDTETDAPGSFLVSGTYSVPAVPFCSGGVGGIGRFDWGCVDEIVPGSDPLAFIPGHKARPGDSMAVFSIESPFPPGRREFVLFVEWDPDAQGTRFSLGNPPRVLGVTVGPTDPSELVIYDGGGQKPVDVNKFLTYTNPLEHRTKVPAAQTRFALSIRYGATIVAGTFTATLNGVDVTSRFAPAAGGIDVVTLDLAVGSNTLVLSANGTTASGRTAADTDRLVFLLSD